MTMVAMLTTTSTRVTIPMNPRFLNILMDPRCTSVRKVAPSIPRASPEARGAVELPERFIIQEVFAQYHGCGEDYSGGEGQQKWWQVAEALSAHIPLPGDQYGTQHCQENGDPHQAGEPLVQKSRRHRRNQQRIQVP